MLLKTLAMQIHLPISYLFMAVAKSGMGTGMRGRMFGTQDTGMHSLGLREIGLVQSRHIMSGSLRELEKKGKDQMEIAISLTLPFAFGCVKSFLLLFLPLPPLGEFGIYFKCIFSTE